MTRNIRDEIRDHVMYSDKASGPRDDEEIALPDSPPGSRSTALLARIAELEARLAVLQEELHAIKYEVMGGEDVPGSANMATVDDVRKEMDRLRAIERKCRT